MNAQTGQPQLPSLPTASYNDVLFLKLAREIAMDIRPLEEVLKSHGVSGPRWTEIQAIPRFQQYLRQAMEEWASAANTSERVRLKSLAIVEEVLPEFYARMHDARETLTAKTEVLKSIAKFGGVGNGPGTDVDLGNRMTVTINLGEDKKIQIEKDVTPRGNPVLNYDLDAEIEEEFAEVAGDSAPEDDEMSDFEEPGIEWNWDKEDIL